MRAITGIIVVVLAFGLSLLSQVVEKNADYLPFVIVGWSVLATLTLVGLVWLYTQIAIGPRSTVPEQWVLRLERNIERVTNGRGWFKRWRLRRLFARAQTLAGRIEPEREAKNVYRRRVRLTNTVMVLIAILSFAFWTLTSLGTKLWPDDPMFTTGNEPDAVQAALFSVDQITRGVMFDVFEVFDWKFSGLQNNPSNVFFSTLIVIYRLLVGGALVAALAVRFGVRDDWREKAARESAEATKTRLTKLHAG